MVPVMTSWVLEAPTVAMLGVNPPVVLIVGVRAPLIVYPTRFETAPPVFITSMKAVPAVVSRLAGTKAET